MKLKKILTVILVVFVATVYIQNNVYKKSKNNIKETIILSDVKNQKEIGEKKAIKLVKDYLKNNNAYLAEHIEVDSVDNKYYIIHVYDIITNDDESHTATTGWYQVNKYTGEIIDIMQ